MIIALDFETRSRVNLKTHGTDNYACDPSTDIICCSFIRKDTGAEWLWFAGDFLPDDLFFALQDATEIEAHNARFDQLIYEYIAVEYGFPPLKKEKWVCTSAQCRVNALPANLDGATRAANAKHKKDFSGGGLIRQLSIPQKNGEFNRDPKLIKDMGKYCMTDSRALVSLTGTLRPLSAPDMLDWQVNERINDRGILVDLELAHLAQRYAEEEKLELGKQLSELTDGAITKVTQTARLLKVLVPEFREAGKIELLACITKPRKNPTDPIKYTLDKAARGQLLERAELPEYWRRVIQLIDDGGASSVAKFTSMIQRADSETGRVHGAFIFAGAGQTQRYSSKGLQLHNFRRDCFNAEQTEDLKTIMKQGGDIRTAGLNVMQTLAKLLRPTIIPAPRHKFVVGDWSAIEARTLPWLTGTPESEKVLDVFREDRDIYVETATGMGIADRQIGKVAVLSLGYQGGVAAFKAMGKNYGLVISDSNAQTVVDQWRRANKWCVKFWAQTEKAATKAVRNPETVYTSGRLRYVFLPALLGGTLCCVLPNDTIIQYPYCRIEHGKLTAMKASVQPKADSDDEWPRMSLYGGILVQGATQATAACLLREALAECQAYDFPVVFHTHDEIGIESPDEEVDFYLEQLQDIMEDNAEWSEGLPLKAVPEIFERYGK